MRHVFHIFLSCMTAYFFLLIPIKIQADEIGVDAQTVSSAFEEGQSEEICEKEREPSKVKTSKYFLGAALLAVAAGVGGYYIGKDDNHTKVIKPAPPICSTNCECPDCERCPVCPSATVNDNLEVRFFFDGNSGDSDIIVISYLMISPDGSYRNNSATLPPDSGDLVVWGQGNPLAVGTWSIVITGVKGASDQRVVRVVASTTNRGTIADESFNTINPGDQMTINFTIS